MIKLIATDLDGTLLNSNMEVSENNLRALRRCVDEGIHIVVATGRSLHSIPKQVRSIEGLKYLICANGAKVHNNITEELLYAKYIDPIALRNIWAIFEDDSIICELFWDGKPHVSQRFYDDPEKFGIPESFRDYFRRSRTPIENLPEFASEHIAEIENINFIFGDIETKKKITNYLAGQDSFELTSSFPFNIEIGGVGVNKATALDLICKKLNLLPDEVMSFGDNANDSAMIKYAGVGVAMENAVSSVKENSVFVTLDRNDDGVAYAIDLMLDGDEF